MRKPLVPVNPVGRAGLLALPSWLIVARRLGCKRNALPADAALLGIWRSQIYGEVA